MAEQNLNQGIELHSKAQALSLLPFPSTRRGAATIAPFAFLSRTPPVFTNANSSCHPPMAQDPLSLLSTLLLRGVRKQQNYPPSVVALPLPPRGIPPSFSPLSLLLPSPFIPRNPFPTISSTPPLPPLRGRSCRFSKCKYQPRNKRQRLVVQDESIVSA